MLKPLNYFLEVKAEMDKVTWPKVSEVTKLTITVLIITAVVGAYLGSLDLGFTKLLEYTLT